MNQQKQIQKFFNDQNLTFKWDFGGKNVFLKLIYMPKTQMGGIKVREFSYKMTQIDEDNIYDFEVDVNLKTLIKKFFECDQDYKSDSNSKFEESKPQDDERALLSAMKMIKSLQYVFEVDGHQKINVGDSLMSNSQNSPLVKKYQQLNEINIENDIQSMISPLTNFIQYKRQPLNEKALAGLPSKLDLISAPSSIRSESTYMSSQQSLRSETSSAGIFEPSSLNMDELNVDMGSVSSPKNMRTSFTDDQDPDEVVGVCALAPQTQQVCPPVSMNKWQRKHNKFVLSALKLQGQQQQLQLQAKKSESDYYYSYCAKENVAKNNDSICCQDSIICCCTTTTTTTTTTFTNNFNSNNNLNNGKVSKKDHHHKDKKRVTFALDIDISMQMPQTQCPPMPESATHKPSSSSWKSFGFWPSTVKAVSAKNTALCY